MKEPGPWISNTTVRRKGFTVLSDSQVKTCDYYSPPALLDRKKTYKELKQKQVHAVVLDEESFMTRCYLNVENIFSVIDFLIQSYI